MYFCQGGDLYVLKDGEPLSSPYGRSDYGLEDQPFITLEASSVDQMLKSFSAWVENWEDQIFKAVRVHIEDQKLRLQALMREGV